MRRAAPRRARIRTRGRAADPELADSQPRSRRQPPEATFEIIPICAVGFRTRVAIPPTIHRYQADDQVIAHLLFRTSRAHASTMSQAVFGQLAWSRRCGSGCAHPGAAVRPREAAEVNARASASAASTRSARASLGRNAHRRPPFPRASATSRARPTRSRRCGRVLLDERLEERPRLRLPGCEEFPHGDADGQTREGRGSGDRMNSVCSDAAARRPAPGGSRPPPHRPHERHERQRRHHVRRTSRSASRRAPHRSDP